MLILIEKKNILADRQMKRKKKITEEREKVRRRMFWSLISSLEASVPNLSQMKSIHTKRVGTLDDISKDSIDIFSLQRAWRALYALKTPKDELEQQNPMRCVQYVCVCVRLPT